MMHELGHRPAADAGLRSGRHAGAGRGFRPVTEPADVDDTVAIHGEDLPAPGRSALPHEPQACRRRPAPPEVSRAGGHLGDHRSCTGGSRAWPTRRSDLVAVTAVGVAGTLRRTPAGTGAEQIPDRIKIAELQGGPDSSGERRGSSAALASSGIGNSRAVQ